MIRHFAIAFALLAASSVGAADKKLERTFAVSPGGVLTVDSDSATVRVSGGDTNQVTVRMSARGSEEDLDEAKLEAVQTDGGVTVTLRLRKNNWLNWASWDREASIEVTVPRRYGVDVHTSGGSVELSNTTGTASLRSSGGSVVAKNVNGNVEARTSGGGIHAENIRGDVDASTSGGSVRLLNIDGKIRGRTSGGSVECSLVGVNRGISASTSGGSIRVTVPRATTGNLNATTSGGSVNSDLPVAATSQQKSHLKGTINGGGEPIDAHTSGGSISLRVAN
jgi:DUF4097 and DUF4098 domain-containing protein YvlB